MFLNIMAENFPNLMRNIYISKKISESQVQKESHITVHLARAN